MQKSNRDYIFNYNQLQKECDTIYRAAAKMGLSDCAFWIIYTLMDGNGIYIIVASVLVAKNHNKSLYW